MIIFYIWYIKEIVIYDILCIIWMNKYLNDDGMSDVLC